ncbi:dTMP kinase [Hydrogenovibrio sp. JE_KL2]|uniref:dTMP kinase n=1 Tax=Hydrogenovibrio sp. JE_KL2 TaxID=2651188 RepID=UPI00128BB380|nr:dTMP kinase [Hydrogenovibrio sp. JE_KL2]MPQ77059.1 dTMP kinase [Hydrogenovibrio sp. JE_KL2]
MKNKYPGKFITLEGTEGAGKSTNLKFIETWLTAQGIDVVVTREPGGTPISEAAREILLDKRYTEMTPETELLLMFAARNQHLQEKIIPALEAGKWVVSDRFTDASYAYQGAARGLPYGRILELEQWVQQGFFPNLTFVFDLSIEEGMRRVKARGEADRFEEEQQEFFEKVRSAYLNRAKQAPQRYEVIDAGQALVRVQEQVEKKLKQLCLAAGKKVVA